MPSKQDPIECVGLIPAGGKAERISPLPCSKEIFPVGFGKIGPKRQVRPKAAVHYLLEKMHLAGARQAFIVLSKGKWDIPAYLADGSLVNLALAYLVTPLPYGVPFTVDCAFPFLDDKRVLFGFPDILLQPDDVYLHLLKKLDASAADLVLGLFPAVDPQRVDMVALNSDGTIAGIDIKPAQTHLQWTWTIAVWKPAFTRFMHEVVHQRLTSITAATAQTGPQQPREWFMGDVVREAIGSGLHVDPVMFPHGSYIDIGSAEDMRTAVQRYAPSP